MRESIQLNKSRQHEVNEKDMESTNAVGKLRISGFEEPEQVKDTPADGPKSSLKLPSIRGNPAKFNASYSLKEIINTQPLD